MTSRNFYPLYDRRFDHDACGVAVLAETRRGATRELVERALRTLENLTHRGAVNADGRTADGAGILMQLPADLFAAWLADHNVPAAPGTFAVANCFLPHDDTRADAWLEEAARAAGLAVVGWRETPVNLEALGDLARATCPRLRQLIVARPEGWSAEAFEQACYRARKVAEGRWREAGVEAYVASFSSRTIVYKGMVLPEDLPAFYLDLSNPLCRSAVAVVHTRFSTNTQPAWARAQPMRLLCHNGEINTLQGNINWMKAREVDIPAEETPVIDESGSDSAMLDNVAELLVRHGRDIREALLMMLSDAWENHPHMPESVRAFYAVHAALMEPWDGPAAVCFTDGRIAGARLDRNGLRPMRYDITRDGLLVVASEAGAAELDPADVIEHGRLGPGEMIAADVELGLIERNDALKARIAADVRAAESARTLHVQETPHRAPPVPDADTLTRQQAVFGYTSEEIQVIITPMVWHAKEPIGAMGDDTPHAVLSDLPRPLFHYFRQRFAEVTNPPIDHLRERAMFSLRVHLGALLPILERHTDVSSRLVLTSPFLTPEDIERVLALGGTNAAFRTAVLDTTFPIADGARGMYTHLQALCARAEAAVRDGARILILDDRHVSPAHAPFPSALVVGAVHHHLLRTGLRARCSLVAFSGEARDPHQMAVLIGYGANAVSPWLLFETAVAIGKKGFRGETLTADEAVARVMHALEDGLLKIMAKMGIATVESYCGAQIFEILGLADDVVDGCFHGTPSRVGGIGYDALAEIVLAWHRHAFGEEQAVPELPSPGFYKFKKGGEYHAFNPIAVRTLQQAVRTPGALNGHFAEGFAIYRRYAAMIDGEKPFDLRHFVEFVESTPIPIDEVEPATSIVRRFSTAAMSFGSLSPEAHETLAIAMNRLGGMSNSGEGGEPSERYGTERNSACKQVASGRFGVTPSYLMSARELQIKMAQGSKPGEGGHLPGHKVTVEIAAIRHTEPGTTLISPPPHHDIYSIEDLAQLIYDLRTINPTATISVKLVAQAGVGTIAAGVVKAGADVVLISGHSGGTGASPLSSIKHAGVSWELGLAETQQVLVANGLRDRVRLRVDGGLRTARDVVVAALLGADEFSFGTAALIAEGCIMARICHKNTCPVGIATQKGILREKFDGTPEHIMAFFLYVAEDIRSMLAQLGARSLDEIVGRTDLLRPARVHEAPIDVQCLLAPPQQTRRYEGAIVDASRRPSDLELSITRDVLHDIRLYGRAHRAYTLHNTNRSVGARLAGELAIRYGDAGLPSDTITLRFEGYAGQSFGAFALPGTTMHLEGVANDYVGKGLAGGKLIIAPPRRAAWQTEVPLIGNVALYGATGGQLYVAGRAGDRFAVRNSGATGVVEGVGAHGCEYMTGGVVVILGTVGPNFAAGMSGGVAYVYDEEGTFMDHFDGEFVVAMPLSEEDEQRVRSLVECHRFYTHSPKAAALLAEWESVRSKFVKIAPHR
nr:glutamate synthase large subunit [Ardenticatena sp.]